MRTVPLSLALLLAGCAGVSSLSGHGVPPTTEEEKVVARFILDHAGEPASVEFVEWGPHKPASEVRTLLMNNGKRRSFQDPPQYRVRYRMKNTRGAMEAFDAAFEIDNGTVKPADHRPAEFR